VPGAGTDVRNKESILLNVSLHTDDSGVEVPLSFLSVTKSGVEMPLSLPPSAELGSKSIAETFKNVWPRESSERPLGADFRLTGVLKSLSSNFL
jgi:hypothetical protein